MPTNGPMARRWIGSDDGKRRSGLLRPPCHLGGRGGKDRLPPGPLRLDLAQDPRYPGGGGLARSARSSASAGRRRHPDLVADPEMGTLGVARVPGVDRRDRVPEPVGDREQVVARPHGVDPAALAIRAGRQDRVPVTARRRLRGGPRRRPRGRRGGGGGASWARGGGRAGVGLPSVPAWGSGWAPRSGRSSRPRSAPRRRTGGLGGRRVAVGVGFVTMATGGAVTSDPTTGRSMPPRWRTNPNEIPALRIEDQQRGDGRARDRGARPADRGDHAGLGLRRGCSADSRRARRGRHTSSCWRSDWGLGAPYATHTCSSAGEWNGATRAPERVEPEVRADGGVGGARVVGDEDRERGTGSLAGASGSAGASADRTGQRRGFGLAFGRRRPARAGSADRRGPARQPRPRVRRRLSAVASVAGSMASGSSGPGSAGSGSSLSSTSPMRSSVHPPRSSLVPSGGLPRSNPRVLGCASIATRPIAVTLQVRSDGGNVRSPPEFHGASPRGTDTPASARLRRLAPRRTASSAARTAA